MNRSDMYKYCGDLSQLFYAREYRFAGGKADGMLAVDINNGSGLLFTVLADRAMDIGHLSLKGNNFSYISKCGYVAPAYFEDSGAESKKSFTAGFLTTCGLTQVGPPCESDGEQLGRHGNVSSLPAEDFSAEVDLEKDVPEIILKGKMRYGYLFGYNLWMRREIRVQYGVNSITIKDVVENRDGNPCPYMILYHFNIGYPLLDEDAVFDTGAEFLRPRDDDAKDGIDLRGKFETPKLNYKEQVFYYRSRPVKEGLCYAGVYNDKLKGGIRIWFDPAQLPDFVQWKNPGFGDYVLGIEPSNCYPEGRAKQKEYGLKAIEPFGKRTQELTVEIT
jgi:hypothetical protein